MKLTMKCATISKVAANLASSESMTTFSFYLVRLWEKARRNGEEGLEQNSAANEQLMEDGYLDRARHSNRMIELV